MATTKKSNKSAEGVKKGKSSSGVKKGEKNSYKSTATPSSKGDVNKKPGERPQVKKASSSASGMLKADKDKPVHKKPQPSKGKTGKQERSEKPVTDQNLIPVKGEMHLLNEQERRQHESMFRHNQDVALHSEQQKIKAAPAANNLMSRKFLKGRNS